METGKEAFVTDQLAKWVERAEHYRNLWEFSVKQANDCILELQDMGVVPPENKPHLTLIIGGLSLNDPRTIA